MEGRALHKHQARCELPTEFVHLPLRGLEGGQEEGAGANGQAAQEVVQAINVSHLSW